MELGKEIEDSVVEEIIKSQRPEECALLIYTVRTTFTSYTSYSRSVHIWE